jgi:2-polyprenyl-6-hydroxyphenyl methylase/3-demethylubiquinone-9 3-methyltransferase
MFDFGKNWRNFSLNVLDDASLQVAEQSLLQLVPVDTFAGKTLLDLGCGSGVFSIAAARMGAEVTAADVSPLCLEVTQANARRFLPSERALRTVQLSALDERALSQCAPFDVVYSWGVLHHTGSMWQAIENAAERVKPEGLFVISIYNQHLTSPVWKRIKRLYVGLPAIGQQVMAALFAGVIYGAKWAATRQNPLKKERGMSFWHDVIDWVGGYPYEYATAEAVIRFVEPRGFRLERMLPAQVPTGCNEFVFMRVPRETPDRQ